MFESALEAALSSCDIPELKSTQDVDKYADFIVTVISTAVDKAIPTSKSGSPESQPVLDGTLVLIKEKCVVCGLGRGHMHPPHIPVYVLFSDSTCKD